MKKQHLIIILLFSFLLAVPAVQAQKKVLPAELEVELKYGADRLGKRQDPAMQKFRENRLGAFIHWGLYAIPGGEWKDLFEYNVQVDMDKVQDASMVQFDMGSPVEVMVKKNNGTVREVAIRPLSKGIEYKQIQNAKECGHEGTPFQQNGIPK